MGTHQLLTEEERHYLDKKYHLRHANRENYLLGRVMRRIRGMRPVLDRTNMFSVIETNDLFQVWLQTPPCRFSKKGSCTICNYWAGQNIPGLVGQMRKAVCVPPQINSILINTCGSCLDESELELEEQEQLFDWLCQQQHAQDVILETHMFTLSERVIQRVCRCLPDKNIYFEVGQESTDPDVQFYSLNKILPESGRHTVLDRIHRYGAQSIVNVVLGSPFLNKAEQVQDACRSVIQLLQEGADHIMLFPVNIKPHTLVQFLYDNGAYAPITGGMLAEALDALPQECLPQTGIAWYGEHQETGVLSPYVPEGHQAEFNALAAAYNSCGSAEDRKQCIQALRQKTKHWEQDQFWTTADGRLSERLDKAYQLLMEQFLQEAEDVGCKEKYRSTSAHERHL